MKYRYQLILLGSIENPIIKEIKKQIISEIIDLKLPKGIINMIDRRNPAQYPAWYPVPRKTPSPSWGLYISWK